MKFIEEVVEIISSQQKDKKEYSAVYQVGEQLKDIAKAIPGAAELLLNDLKIPEMSIGAAAKKIKERADEIHKSTKGGCVCVPPSEAHRILCEFYGIPNSETFTNLNRKPKRRVRLADFM